MTDISDIWTLEELRGFKEAVAVIIARDGPDLVPLFIHLEEEEAKFAVHQGALARARCLAADNRS